VIPPVPAATVSSGTPVAAAIRGTPLMWRMAMNREFASAREEIRAKIELYFAAIDSRQFALLREVFTQDATGFWMEEVSGIEGIVSRISRVARFTSSTHVTGNSIITFDDASSATAITEAVAYLEVPGDDSRIIVRGLRYSDHFVTSVSGWRIQRRIHQPKWQYTHLAEPPSLPVASSS
jgi:SnoaL-like domain